MIKSVFISDDNDPVINLACEEALMNKCRPNEMILFLWQCRSTVVIGKHQNPYLECNLKRMQEDNVQLVRRMSGGGAVYHDLGNLNYSFIAYKAHFAIERHFDIVLQALKQLGVKAVLNDRNDLCCGEDKFSGSAFIHHKELSCHHGTLLIDTNLDQLDCYLKPKKQEVMSKSIASVRSSVCNLGKLVECVTIPKVVDQLIQIFDREISGDLVLNRIGAVDHEKYEAKYHAWAWNYGHTPKYEWSINGDYVWGQCKLTLKIRNGSINSINIESSDLPTTFFEQLKGELVNKELRLGVLTDLQVVLQANKIYVDILGLISRQLVS